jgi:hypothetical protein
VGRTGIEPVTSCVSSKRSPAELTPPDPGILAEGIEAASGIEPLYRALQALA